ncbi:MAG TPA: hypothetical protein VFB54_10485 [Burkholderiales bacterium]|nr:hypothetical protein [Burkholderiales bacterium]
MSEQNRASEPSHTERIAPSAVVAALLSALSHDLRAALNAISVWTHILERSADATTLRAVEGIRRAVTQQSQLALELSEFGHAMANEEPSAESLTAVLESAARTAQHGGEALVIDFQLPPSLPQVTLSGAALRAIVGMLFVDLRAQGGEGTRIIVTGQADDRSVDVRLLAVDRDGRPVCDGERSRRRSLRETLTMLGAAVHDASLHRSGHEMHLRLPRA